ncbi:MAG: hybrid sensor histidine kinase/response regulator, partial [Planctomycetota bacterium]
IGLKAASRASEISRNLLRFARRAESRKRLGDLNAIVRDTINLLRMDFEAQHIAVETRLAPLPEVLLDVGQIQQLLLNVLVNARQSLQQVRGPRRVEMTTWLDGEWVCARIHDNGSGIPEEVQHRVFEPFYTTRGVISGGAGEATGLGLSVAEGIARNHEGTLSVERPEEGGAALVLRLPVPGERSHAAAVRVLVVDDDEALRRVVSAVLEGQGCEVVCAPGGVEAMEYARAGDIDVVLLDYSMPGMDGLAVLRELQLRQPDLPVLMVTALHSADLARTAILAGARECISKPVNNDKLLFLVRKYGAHDDSHTPAESEREAAAVLARRPHVLVVEDDEVIRDVYGLVLSRAGFELTAVADVADGLRRTEDHYFDLILLDLEVPHPEELKAVRTFRANNPFTPLIISSPEVSDDMLRHGHHAGASRVLLKPINPDGLVREVTRLLSIYREAPI